MTRKASRRNLDDVVQEPMHATLDPAAEINEILPHRAYVETYCRCGTDNNGSGESTVTVADVTGMVRAFSRQLAALAPTPHAAHQVGQAAQPTKAGQSTRAGGKAAQANAARVSDATSQPVDDDDAADSVHPGPISVSPVLLAEGKPAEDLLVDLVRTISQVEGYAALLVSLIDQDQWWRRYGSRNCLSFLTDHLHLPYGQAMRLAELGEGLRKHLPRTTQLLCAGKISTHHAQSMCTSMTASEQLVDSLTQPANDDDAGPTAPGTRGPDLLDGLTESGANQGGIDPQSGDCEDPPAITGQDSPGSDTGQDSGSADDAAHAVFGPVLDGEQVLLARAVSAKPKVFRDSVQAHAQRVDPEARERDYAHQHAAQSLEILSHHKGGYLINGYLDDEAGQMLKLVLGALRRQLPRETRIGTSINHQHALALGMLARLDLEHVLTTTKNGASLHLNVALDFDTFTRAATSAGVPPQELPHEAELAPARWANTRGPIPDSALERMACDSKVARIIFGPDSQVLNAGEEVRIATAHQRRAVMARDTNCVFPNCTAPPGICEVHHLDEWIADGGPTNIDNLALLCWAHHHHIHEQHLKLTRIAGSGWQALKRSDRVSRRC